jgi:cellulose synthase/poly-beta-1,6-N-acetylglucosamine synthase-like glycosyltransferase
MVLRTDMKGAYVDSLGKILSRPMQSQELPCVSILIPAHNEEAVIYGKLQNISESEYPMSKIEVIVIDDCSTDRTAELAQRALEDFKLHGNILRNTQRKGVNASYNWGVSKAQHDYVLTTDADVLMHKDAVRRAAQILMELDEVGGVTARMAPIFAKDTRATRIEESYRSMFDSMMVAESAIFSTFPGYTCFLLFRKSLYSEMPADYGSSDGNISLSIVKKGFRYIMPENLFFYEPVAQGISEQRRQKIRRASRLIQSTLMNRDMLLNRKYKKFGQFIFPLRFLMLTVCPVLIFIAPVAAIVWMCYVSVVALSFMLLFCGVSLLLGLRRQIRLFVLPTSLMIHQVYLLLGLICSSRRKSLWKRIERGPASVLDRLADAQY